MQNKSIARVSNEQQSLLRRFSAKFGMNEKKFYESLMRVIFKDAQVTVEEVAAFLIVCEQYDLNPFLKEIYPAITKDGLLPVLGVDGWFKQMNRNPDFDGAEVEFSENETRVSRSGRDGRNICTTGPEWCRVKIYLKGKSHPISIEERLSETFMPTKEWISKPYRMLRHKAFIQAIRVAFGISGVYDKDEVQEITPDRVVQTVQPAQPVASAVRTFADDAAREQYVRKIINGCEARGVLDQAQEFFKERLIDEDLDYALTVLEEHTELASRALEAPAMQDLVDEPAAQATDPLQDGVLHE